MKGRYLTILFLLIALPTVAWAASAGRTSGAFPTETIPYYASPGIQAAKDMYGIEGSASSIGWSGNADAALTGIGSGTMADFYDSSDSSVFSGVKVKAGVVNVDVTSDFANTIVSNGAFIAKDPIFDIRAYGAVADSASFDSAASIQSAIDAAEAAQGTLYVPNGTFYISTSLNITDAIKMIRGEGYNSVIKASTVLEAILDFTSGGTDATANDYVTIKDIFLNGDSKANYGIKATKFTRADMYGVVSAANVIAGVGLLENQWINNFWGCKFSNNGSYGMIFGTTSTNIINIYNTAIEGNGVMGIYARGSATALNIIGNTIEGNGETGIWAFGQRVLAIHNNYFEDNVGGGGVTVTDPTSFTLNADVIINGDIYPDISPSNTNKSVSIKNNFHSGNLSADAMYYITGMETGEVTNNYSHATSVVLVGTYGARANALITNLSTDNNRDQNGLFDETITIMQGGPAVDSGQFHLNSHTFKFADVDNKNYMPQDFTAYTKVVDLSTSSTLIRSFESFRGMDGFGVVKAGGSSDVWGATLDIDNDYPELLGKLMYFGAWVKWSGTNNVRLWTTTTGYHSGSGTTSAEWTFISIMFNMPDSGATAWKLGFRKLNAGTTDTVYVANPILTRIGNGYLSNIVDWNPPTVKINQAMFSSQSAEATTTEGTVAYADSTNWNPGEEEGLYVYSNATWEKLNRVDSDIESLTLSGTIDANGTADFATTVTFNGPLVSSGETGSDTWDPGNILDGNEEAFAFTVTGATLGDYALCSFSIDVTDIALVCDVTVADVITAVMLNSTGDSIDLGSGTIRGMVIGQ